MPWTTDLILRLWIGLAGLGAGRFATDNAKTVIANAAGDGATAGSEALATFRNARDWDGVSVEAAILARRGTDWYPMARTLGATIALVAGLVPWAPGLLESLRSVGNPRGKVLLGDVS